MRLGALIIVVMLIMLVFSCYSKPPVAGFTIVEPNPGAIYQPGDRVTLRAMTGPNERPAAVYLSATQMQFAELFTAEPYKLVFTVPVEFTGSDTLVASEKFVDGAIIEKERGQVYTFDRMMNKAKMGQDK